MNKLAASNPFEIQVFETKTIHKTVFVPKIRDEFYKK